jgi:hypothetical protein
MDRSGFLARHLCCLNCPRCILSSKLLKPASLSFKMRESAGRWPGAGLRATTASTRCAILSAGSRQLQKGVGLPQPSQVALTTKPVSQSASQSASQSRWYSQPSCAVQCRQAARRSFSQEGSNSCHTQCSATQSSTEQCRAVLTPVTLGERRMCPFRGGAPRLFTVVGSSSEALACCPGCNAAHVHAGQQLALCRSERCVVCCMETGGPR